MLVVLFVTGICFLLAGLAAIGFGIQIYEFGLGNTLIIAGTVAACTGMVLIGLWTAVKELKTIAGRLGLRDATALHAESVKQPTAVTAATNHPTAEPEPASHAESAPPSLAPSPPWHGEAAPRERVPGDSSLPAAEPAPAAKPKRNLLFSSSSRRERERAQARTDPSEPAAPPPVPESQETPPASFDDAWPKLERSRSEVPPPRRAGRTPSTFAEPEPAADSGDHYPPAVRSEEQAEVTVLKSGVVDGMAYSLYSDGSIEAQMPEGMMRFASIDELRSHLDHRS
jgi:FtsZ-interacting cell division protein ZipA